MFGKKKQVVTAQPAVAAYVPVDSDFVRKDNAGEIAIDTNFASQSFWKDVIIRFKHKKSAVIGLILVIVDGSEKMNTTTGTKITNEYAAKKLYDTFYWFGTDRYGRDIFTRTWSGTRVSLIIAFAATIIDMVIGMSYGLISGYFGGKTDIIMQRILEIMNGIPRLVIVTLLLLVLQPGMVTIIFALMLTEWVGMSRIARAEMLKLKEQEFGLQYDQCAQTAQQMLQIVSQP